MNESTPFYIPGIGDAPSDGTVYGRRNAAWVPVPSGGGGAFPVDWGLITEPVLDQYDWGDLS